MEFKFIATIPSKYNEHCRKIKKMKHNNRLLSGPGMFVSVGRVAAIAVSGRSGRVTPHRTPHRWNLLRLRSVLEEGPWDTRWNTVRTQQSANASFPQSGMRISE